MDLGAAAGTEVHAAFDGHVTRFHPHVPAHDTSKVFGARLFMRSDTDPITNVPGAIRGGARIRRGDVLGKVHPGHGTPHLHLALVEIIGGPSHGPYKGVNLFSHFLSTANSSRVSHVAVAP